MQLKDTKQKEDNRNCGQNGYLMQTKTQNMRLSFSTSPKCPEIEKKNVRSKLYGAFYHIKSKAFKTFLPISTNL